MEKVIDALQGELIEVKFLTCPPSFASLRRLVTACFLQTETAEVEGKMLLIADIQEGVNKPYKDLHGNIYVKQGADKRRLMENTEILRLFHESRSFAPDESPVLMTTINDVDSRLFASYIRKVYECEVEDFGMSFEQLLNNLRIMDGQGHLTLAGLLFFGKQPQRYCPSFMIKAVAFYGNDLGGTEYRDSKDIEGTIPEIFEQGMSFLKANLHQVQAGQPFNSIGKLEVSQIALEEILQNALVHREYIKTAPIRLLIFDNRIEIVSPGALADGLTIEDIKLGNTFRRNQLIAGFCAKTMMYRGLGSGLLRAYKDGAKLQFINSESGKQFTTIVYREDSAQLNNKFAQLDNDTAQIGALTELQKKILQYLQAHPTASRTDLAIGIKDTTIDKVKHSLTRLQELDILQRVGSKRYGHWEVKINFME